MQKLTRAEEEVMIALWDLNEGIVRDVIEKLDEPDTPYTTVSTVIRVLEKKKFVHHRVIGNTYLYYPLISKEEYLNELLPGILKRYFNGSFTELTNFFVQENNLSMKELSELIESVSKEMENK